jgi:hypothetical protein
VTPEEAAWQRDNVWPNWMRKQYAENPGFYTHCACEWGMTAVCEIGQCHQCQGSARNPSPLATITSKRGYVTGFHAPHKHHEAKVDGSYGPHTDAAVWPAGTPCRWRCPHDCHTKTRPEPDTPTPKKKPTKAEKKPEPTPDTGQLGFDLELTNS